MNFEDGYNITMNDFVKKKINEEFLDYDKNDRYLHYQAT